MFFIEMDVIIIGVIMENEFRRVSNTGQTAHNIKYVYGVWTQKTNARLIIGLNDSDMELLI